MDIDETMDSQASELIDSQMETEEVPRLEFTKSLIGTPKAIKVNELQALLKVNLIWYEQFSTEFNINN